MSRNPQCLKCEQEIKGTPASSKGSWHLCKSCDSVGYRMRKQGKYYALFHPDGYPIGRCQEIQYQQEMARP